MSLYNTVADSSPVEELKEEPTAMLFGWDQKKNGLTKDLGQPRGNTISSMHLDSMKHAIIMNRGEVPFTIEIVLPASIVEFVIILAIPGAVFVSRYLSTPFFDAQSKSIRQSMVHLGGEMNVKVGELAGADGPQERGVPVGSYFAVYYPEAAPGQNGQDHCQMKIDALKREFEYHSRIQFQSAKYSPNATTVTITVPPQARAMVSHKTG